MNTLPAILAATFAAPLAVGAAAVSVLGRRGKSAPRPALVFHSVLASRGPGVSYFPVARFDSLLQALVSRGFTFKTLSEASLPAPAEAPEAILTFDDGFRCFVDNALPLLRKHRARVTVFPVAGFLGKRSGWDVYSGLDHLSEDNLRLIASEGHEIGSHSLTHPDLTLLSSADLRTELADSKAKLEDIINAPVRALAFPGGCWNQRAWETAQELGYCRATVYRGYREGLPGLVPACGVYAFDTVEDVIERIDSSGRPRNAVTRGKIMPHFAKGAFVWRFRRDYVRLPALRG